MCVNIFWYKYIYATSSPHNTFFKSLSARGKARFIIFYHFLYHKALRPNDKRFFDYFQSCFPNWESKIFCFGYTQSKIDFPTSFTTFFRVIIRFRIDIFFSFFLSQKPLIRNDKRFFDFFQSCLSFRISKIYT